MVKRINEIRTHAKEKGFDITKNRAETLGFVSRYFIKKEMKKVGSVILMDSQKVHQSRRAGGWGWNHLNSLQMAGRGSPPPLSKKARSDFLRGYQY